MSYRQSNSSPKDDYLLSQSRLNQQFRCDSTDEGCPVLEESGTVCGETNSLSIFQEFRQMYDDCIQKLEGTVNGNATLKKLAPFKKLIDDLWEQNTMLVETVEELEQEATYRVTNLQDRLNKSCQKVCDYKDDIKCLVKIIQSFCENGVFDPTGLKFKTFCCSSVFGNCDDSCSKISKHGEQSEVSFKKKSGFLRSTSQSSYKVQQISSVGQCNISGSSPSKTYSSKGIICNNVKNINSSKLPPDNCEAPPYYDPPCNNNIAIESSGQSCKCNCDYEEATNCNMPPININFKITNDDTCDSSDCCCDCSCELSTEAYDC